MKTGPASDRPHAFAQGAPVRIEGVVSSGRGEAAGFVDLPWVVEQVRERAGFRPFPGTLNILVRDPASLARWQRVRRVPGFLLEPGDPSFCSASCYPVLVAGRVPGAIVRPHVPSYPEGLVEVLAATCLREELGLRDGDPCFLLLPR